MADIILRGVTTTQVNQEYGRNPVAAFVQQSRQHTRYAESRLEYLDEKASFGVVHEQVLTAERVALNPRPTNGKVPGLKGRRGRPLVRSITDPDERLRWIAQQMDMSPDLVKEVLYQASYYAALQAIIDE